MPWRMRVLRVLPRFGRLSCAVAAAPPGPAATESAVRAGAERPSDDDHWPLLNSTGAGCDAPATPPPTAEAGGLSLRLVPRPEQIPERPEGFRGLLRLDGCSCLAAFFVFR